jgi:hypothetical protein
MAVIGDVMVRFSLLARLTVAIDGMYRILACNHVHSLLLSCLSRYLDKTVERRNAKATRRTGTKATEVIIHGDMVEIYHTIYCGRTTQTRIHLRVLPNWTDRPSRDLEVRVAILSHCVMWIGGAQMHVGWMFGWRIEFALLA